MVDILNNISDQNSIYYNNYNIVNQVFKATLLLSGAVDSVCRFLMFRAIWLSNQISLAEVGRHTHGIVIVCVLLQPLTSPLNV